MDDSRMLIVCPTLHVQDRIVVVCTAWVYRRIGNVYIRYGCIYVYIVTSRGVCEFRC